ncbi:MAG: endonuclease III [Acidobacteriota bacterium]
MKDGDLTAAFRILRREARRFTVPYVTTESRDPYRVLVSCILSLRTKDETTAAASSRLFAIAATPAAMAKLPAARIAKLIFPVGFYRTKAGQIRELSGRLVSEHGGRVPDTIDELLTFKGVGRKTANLVVTLGYGRPGICVDTHVHRITNRWGYVRTKSPNDTEVALRAKLPHRYWIPINDLLVTYGQNVCHPVSPRCSSCKLASFCARTGVTTSR